MSEDMHLLFNSYIMEDQKDMKYWESFFQSLQMTYYSLLAIPLFVFAIAFLRAENGSNKLLSLKSDAEIVLVSTVAILALCVMIGIYFYAAKKYKSAQKETLLGDKLTEFKKASLVKYIVLCIAQIIAVAVFAITYHNALMGVFTALLLYSSFFRPELTTAKKVLKLSKDEFAQINYKKLIIV